jgi:hypothetical protein
MQNVLHFEEFVTSRDRRTVQSRGFLKVCKADPEVRQRVAELAYTFCIDPAATDLDPRIVQRLAAMFCGD